MFEMIAPRNILGFEMEIEGYADAKAITTGSEWEEEISEAIGGGGGAALRKRASLRARLSEAQIEQLFGSLLDHAGPHREQLKKNYRQMFGKV